MGDYGGIGKGIGEIFCGFCVVLIVVLVFVGGFIVGGFLVIFKFNDAASLLAFVWFVVGVSLAAIGIALLVLFILCISGPSNL